MNDNGGQPQQAAVLGPLVREYTPQGRYRRPGGQVAAVLMYENGGYSTVWPDRREDVDKPLIRGPFTVFEVRTGIHTTKFATKLPAAGDAESFRAEAVVRWQVVDAYVAVRAGAWDVAELISPVLFQALRGITRRFRLDEPEQADNEVRAELESGAGRALGEEFGLDTKVFVQIDMSDRGLKGERERTDVDHQRDVEWRLHKLAQEREQRDQELTRMRAGELQEMLSGGDESQIAWFMARDKEHAWDIHQRLRAERREERALSLEAVYRMMDGGFIERHDLNDQTLAAIDFLRTTTGTVLGEASQRIFDRTDQPDRPELAQGDGPGGRERGRTRRELGWADDEDAEDTAEAETADGHDVDDDRDRGRVYEPTRVQPSSERAGRPGPYNRRGRGLDWGDE